MSLKKCPAWPQKTKVVQPSFFSGYLNPAVQGFLSGLKVWHLLTYRFLTRMLRTVFLHLAIKKKLPFWQMSWWSKILLYLPWGYHVQSFFSVKVSWQDPRAWILFNQSPKKGIVKSANKHLFLCSPNTKKIVFKNRGLPFHHLKQP